MNCILWRCVGQISVNCEFEEAKIVMSKKKNTSKGAALYKKSSGKRICQNRTYSLPKGYKGKGEILQNDMTDPSCEACGN